MKTVLICVEAHASLEERESKQKAEQWARKHGAAGVFPAGPGLCRKDLVERFYSADIEEPATGQ